MKKLLQLRLILLTSLALYLTCSTPLQAQMLTGKFSIGGTGNDVGFSLTATKDKGLAITGFEWIYGGGHTENNYVVKLDSTGALSWTKTFGGSGNDEGYSIVQTRDGGYAVSGTTTSGNATLLRLDATGNLLWGKQIGGGAATSLIQASDGGFVMAGYATTFIHDDWIAKYDSTGKLLWAGDIGGIYDDNAKTVVETRDGGYVMAGNTQSYSAWQDTLNYDVYVVKVNKKGKIVWTRTIGGKYDDWANSLVQTQDGGLAVVGYTQSYGTKNDIYIIQLDSSGNVKWTRTVANGSANGIVQTKDGSLVISGSSHGSSGDVFMLKIDAAQNIVYNNITTKAGSPGGVLVKTPDGGFALTGSTDFYGLGGAYDVMLVKFDSLGITCDSFFAGGGYTSIDSGRISSGGILDSLGVSGGFTCTVGTYGAITSSCTGTLTSVNNLSAENNTMNVYPNPFSSYSTIETGTEMQGAILKVYDVTGREVARMENVSGRKITLQRNDLPAGLYLLKLQDKNGYVEMNKIIIE